MDQKNVLVTGIGGNVGQGIIRNIRALKTDSIRVIGTNVTPFSAGNHLCDVFYKIPYSYEDGFIAKIKDIVEKEQIDLLIPSTDYEMLYLTEKRDELGCTIAGSDYKTVDIYTDKYKSYLHHKKNNLPFAKAFLPSEYKGEFQKFILKPRAGRGSRELHFNPTNWSDFSDEYMIQELIEGREITTAFYVNQKMQLHGFINLERTLLNGTTQDCKVLSDMNPQYEKLLNAMLKVADFKGSANLQSIVTSSGEIVPFEINCRISGTNSIRSNFGFEDVKYTLEEYLFNVEPSSSDIKQGVATRILMDVIYPGQTDTSNIKDSSSPHYLF